MNVLQFWIAHRAEFLGLLLQHLGLVAVSTTAAVAIGIPLAIFATRRPRLGAPLIWLVNVAQTIPSLAMFGFLLPLPFIGGLGARVAITVLIVYALLPIVAHDSGGDSIGRRRSRRSGDRTGHDAAAIAAASAAAAGVAVDCGRHPRRGCHRRRHRDDCGRGWCGRPGRVHLSRPVDGRPDGHPGRRRFRRRRWRSRSTARCSWPNAPCRPASPVAAGAAV